MYRYIWLIMMLVFPLISKSQRLFLEQTNGQSRVFLYTNLGSSNAINAPLFIILHNNISTANSTFSLGEPWSQLSSEGNLVFPNALNEYWDCQDTIQTENDILFISAVIDRAYANFKIDRNRVYLITSGESICIAEKFQKTFPDKIAQFASLNANDSSITILEQVERLLHHDVTTNTAYSLYQPIEFNPSLSPIDSLKTYSYYQRWVISLHTGGFYLNNSAQTNITDQTFMDISNAHSMSGIQLTKWRKGPIGWFVDLSRLKIPAEQKISSYTVSTGGGHAIPLTLGIKYRFTQHHFYNAYLLMGAGVTNVLVAGGRISTLSGVANLKNKIETEMRWAFQSAIGSGVDFRFGKRVLIGAQVRYFQSSKFKSIGSINAVNALSFNFSISYVINANNEKNLHDLLNKTD